YNCWNRGFIRATTGSSDAERTLSYTGGITGYVMGGSIGSCYNEAKVRAASGGTIEPGYASDACSGGVAGVAMGAAISKCYNTGEIYAAAITVDDHLASAGAGGVTGWTIASRIGNCYNTGYVQAFTSESISPHLGPPPQAVSDIYQCFAGGIAGYSSSLIETSYNTGQVLSRRTASTGAVAGIAKAYAGGVSGKGDMANQCVSIFTGIKDIRAENGIPGDEDGVEARAIGAPAGEGSRNYYVEEAPAVWAPEPGARQSAPRGQRRPGLSV
ncbi:MAG: hypothetical protein FWH49_03640, partial [Clostridiales bacterium]|nr:hypothetical protein [Clostridiales bacterium]